MLQLLHMCNEKLHSLALLDSLAILLNRAGFDVMKTVVLAF